MPENQQKQLHQTVIPVTIRNKVATAPLDAQIVCDNDNYVILFDFDEEWSGIEYKVARFAYNEQCIDVLFTGNEVRVPVLKCTSLVGIGVYTNNIKTSTPAFVKCISSALSFDDCGNKEPPTYEEYTKIIEILNKMHADFVFKQDKVDNALVTADKTVVGAINELKANIDTEVVNTGKITKFSYGITTKEEFTTENLAKMSGAVLVKGVPFEFQENITVKVPDTVTEIHFVDTTLGWNTLIQGNGKSRIVGTKGHAELVGFGSVINCEAEYIRNSTNIQGCKSSYISDSSFLNNCEADHYSDCTYVDVNTCKRYINEANGQVQILNNYGGFEYRAIQDGDKSFALMEDVNRVTAETDKKLIKKADITYVDNKVASTYTPKGSKQNYSDLNLIPLENRRYGDIYNIINETIITDAQGVETYYAPGTNFVWAKADGTTHTVDFWDALGGNYAELVKLISQNTNKIQDIDEKKLGKTEAEETYVAKDTGVSTADEIAGLYGKDQYGDTYVYPASTRPTDWSAVIRDDKGWARVNTPEDRDNQDPDIAANKGYVKDSFATKKTVQDLDNKKLDKTEAENIYATKEATQDLDDRLSFVEGATNEYLADKSSAVIKPVPVTAYHKAIVSEIGGKTNKSENLYAPTIEFPQNGIDYDRNTGIFTLKANTINRPTMLGELKEVIPIGTKMTITVNILSGKGTNKDVLIGVVDDSLSWSKTIRLPLDFKLGEVTSTEETYRDKATKMYIFIRDGAIITEDVKFTVMANYGDKMQYQIPFNGLSDTKTKAVVSHFANLFDISKVKTNPTIITNNNDGTLTLTKGYNKTIGEFKDLCPNAVIGQRYYLNAKSTGINKFFVLQESGQKSFGDGVFTLTEKDYNGAIFFYSNKEEEVIVSDIVLSGVKNSSYTPYREPITYDLTSTLEQQGGKGVGEVYDKMDFVEKKNSKVMKTIVLDGVNVKCESVAAKPDINATWCRFDKNLFTFANIFTYGQITEINSALVCSLPLSYTLKDIYRSAFNNAEGNRFAIIILPDTVAKTVEEVNEWLKNNPVSVTFITTDKISEPLTTTFDGTVEVEGGGYLEFVTEPTVPNAPKDVPSEVQYIVHKGGNVNA